MSKVFSSKKSSVVTQSQFYEFQYKDACKYATTAAVTLSSHLEDGDPLDSATLATGDRILVKDQTGGSASENGIYTVNASGAPTRAADFNASSEIVSGAFVNILLGTTNANKSFVLTNAGSITLGTTALTFAEITATASEVTVTDNESTAENNLITFVADAGTSTGSHALEMDGHFTYNPSTGTVSATEFVGGGSGITGTVAAAETASEVTVTDNEDTAENNLITFVADAGDITGSHALEMDGDLKYNPSTGLLTAPDLHGRITRVDQSAITSIYNNGLKVGRDTQNLIDFSVDNKLRFRVNNVNDMELTENLLNMGGAITATGDITAFSSDKRLKKDIEIIESPLEKIQKLSGFTYLWNKETCKKAGFNPKDETQIGVFAQDVQEVIPEAVKIAPFDRDDDGNSKSGENYLTVQYEKIIPLLIESIKEQQKQIEELRNELNSLKK